jgi:hypothetical protein
MGCRRECFLIIYNAKPTVIFSYRETKMQTLPKKLRNSSF